MSQRTTAFTYSKSVLAFAIASVLAGWASGEGSTNPCDTVGYTDSTGITVETGQDTSNNQKLKATTSSEKITVNGSGQFTLAEEGAFAAIPDAESNETPGTAIDITGQGVARNQGNICVESPYTGKGTPETHGITLKDNGKATNEGTINTHGERGHVFVTSKEGGEVTNTGTITTTGKSAYAFHLYGGGTGENSGQVTTTGVYAYGAAARGKSTFTNTKDGSIDVQQEGSLLSPNHHGIYATEGSTVANAGSVKTAGYSSHAISVEKEEADSIRPEISGERNVTITNSGSLETTGDQSAGIEASNWGFDGKVTINNSGTIATQGTGSKGIDLTGGTLTNSGSITSDKDAAVKFTANDKGNTANFEKDSVITGSPAIRVSGSDPAAAQVNLTGGIYTGGITGTKNETEFLLLNPNQPTFITGDITDIDHVSVATDKLTFDGVINKTQSSSFSYVQNQIVRIGDDTLKKDPDNKAPLTYQTPVNSIKLEVKSSATLQELELHSGAKVTLHTNNRYGAIKKVSAHGSEGWNLGSVLKGTEDFSAAAGSQVDRLTVTDTPSPTLEAKSPRTITLVTASGEPLKTVVINEQATVKELALGQNGVVSSVTNSGTLNTVSVSGTGWNVGGWIDKARTLSAASPIDHLYVSDTETPVMEPRDMSSRLRMATGDQPLTVEGSAP
ncbi:hypothetical protein, partial [Endozoicomonas numazuensis]|uniref:hypothetical protein n=1 Tax=Endozoicomonas numazuensis TaxID=1137799 RepID=UPI00054D04D7